MDEHDIHKCHSTTLLNESSGFFQRIGSRRIYRDRDTVCVVTEFTEFNAWHVGECVDNGLQVNIDVLERGHNTGDHDSVSVGCEL
jgi:hypothetical protein